MIHLVVVIVLMVVVVVIVVVVVEMIGRARRGVVVKGENLEGMYGIMPNAMVVLIVVRDVK